MAGSHDAPGGAFSGALGTPPPVDLEQGIAGLFGTGLSAPVDVLAIGAHPDDVELAIGGSLASLARGGVDVAILDLTNGEPTPHGSPEVRRQESHEAARLLGVRSRVTLALPNRYLLDEIASRRLVATVIRMLRPKLLLAHYWEDAHPDHLAAGALADAGRFYSKLTKAALPGEPYLPRRTLYFPATHLRLHAPVAFVVDVSGVWERKMAAIRAYRSQFEHNAAASAVPERVAVRDRYFGDLIDRRYGEPFMSREPVPLASLREFVV